MKLKSQFLIHHTKQKVIIISFNPLQSKEGTDKWRKILRFRFNNNNIILNMLYTEKMFSSKTIDVL